MLSKQDLENLIKLLQSSSIKGSEVYIYIDLINKLDKMYIDFDEKEVITDDKL